MKKMRHLSSLSLLWLAVVLLCAAPASSQLVNQEWAANYDHSLGDDNPDEALDVALDAVGNAFVTGRSLRSTTTWDWDYATVKYDPTGTQLWVMRHNSPGNGNDEARAITLDAAGNAYVTGCYGSQVLTIKYDGQTGTVLWSQTSEVDGCGHDIELDFTEGLVLVTGESNGNVLTICYNNHLGGTPNWWDASVAGSAETLAPSGAWLYAVGHTPAPDADYLTVQYDINFGTVNWNRSWGGSQEVSDYAHDVDVLSNGDCVLTGECRNLGTDWDAATISYSGTGSLLWWQVWNNSGSSRDKALALKLDTVDNVYVCGYTDPGITGKDALLLRYSGSTGALLWWTSWDGSGNLDDVAQDVETGSNLEAYIAGYTRNTAGDDDFLCARLSPVASMDWVQIYSGPGTGNQDDQAARVAVNAQQRVALTGFADHGQGDTDRDYQTLCYSQSFPPENDNCAQAIAVGDTQDLPFSTLTATHDGPGGCMSGPNVWYCYTASCTGTAIFSLCGSLYDTMLAIYADCGCDPTGSELCCNDDYDCDGSPSLQSQCSVPVVAGEHYLIEVGGYAELTGSGVLSIRCETEEPDPCTLDQLALWQFDSGSGNTALDASSYGNHGSISGATWTSGIHSNALSFSGGGQWVNGDVVQVPHSPELNLQHAFSISCWIRAQGSDNYLAIVDKYTGSASLSSGYTLYLVNGRPKLSLYCDTNGSTGITGSSELRDDNWHHISAGWDGSSLQIWVDGICENTRPWYWPPAVTSAPLGIGKRIGGWGGYLPFDGIIDELCITASCQHGSDQLLLVDVDADSYVNDSYPAQNYGSQQWLYVGDQNGNDPAQTCRSWLRFDLNVLPADATLCEALVHLKSGNTGGGGLQVGAHYASDDSWSESGLCWNNQPAFTAQALSTINAGHGWNSWDVTAAVRHARFDDGSFSVVLAEPEPQQQGCWIGCSSSEYADPDFHPYLELRYCEDLLFNNPAPDDLQIQANASSLTLNWSPVAGAQGYIVYSSSSAWQGFLVDQSGSYGDCTWTAPLPGNRRFYRVIATFSCGGF